MTDDLDLPTPPSDDVPTVEAAWEQEIAALLGGLDAVEPPPGSIVAAMDHRPLFAGRVFVGAAVALVAVGLGLALSGGLATSVRPQVDRMAQTHGATEAGLLSSLVPNGADDVVFEVADGETEAGEQAVWAIEGRPVSMFREWGTIDFSALSQEGRFELAGHQAWFDGTDVVVAQLGGNAVTFVGVDPEAAEHLLAEVDMEDPDLLDRALSRLDDLTAGLGFAEVD